MRTFPIHPRNTQPLSPAQEDATTVQNQDRYPFTRTAVQDIADLPEAIRSFKAGGAGINIQNYNFGNVMAEQFSAMADAHPREFSKTVCLGLGPEGMDETTVKIDLQHEVVEGTDTYKVGLFIPNRIIPTNATLVQYKTKNLAELRGTNLRDFIDALDSNTLASQDRNFPAVTYYDRHYPIGAETSSTLYTRQSATAADDAVDGLHLALQTGYTDAIAAFTQAFEQAQQIPPENIHPGRSDV